jgi:hypothetical protein
MEDIVSQLNDIKCDLAEAKQWREVRIAEQKLEALIEKIEEEYL